MIIKLDFNLVLGKVIYNSFMYIHARITTLQMFTDKRQTNWCLKVLFLQSDESENIGYNKMCYQQAKYIDI